jgi:3-oxoacyl-[acyl-carrier protein] reductase
VKAATFRLDGRVALVTGASRGIGAAIAQELAGAGASVVLVGRDSSQLQQVAGHIGEQALACVADITDADQLRHSVDQALARFGRIDILVNNAGRNSRGAFDTVSSEEFDEIHDVNLFAPFAYVQLVAGGMRDRRWGRIINIASISAQTGGVSGSVAYSSSKAGLIGMTRTLARDLGPFGVTANAIAPGQIETEMSQVLTDPERASITASIPIGRLGSPEDIAHAVHFLASEEAAYITGATLDVNGGILRR